MSKIKIIYGSGGGNTEIVCERVADILEAEKHEVQLLRAKTSVVGDLKGADLVIFASPTYGHGLLEKYMIRFLKGFGEMRLEGEKAAIIGLGDPKYDNDYHIESVKILRDFLVERGAEIVGMPLRVSKSPIPHLETYIPMWAKNLSEKLAKSI